jgi:hypothetical protein
MSMRSERDGDQLDAAIDAAARSLTEGEPSATLRASVRARISERRSFVRWALVPVAASAAVIVAAVFLGRFTASPSGTPELPPKPQAPALVDAPVSPVEAMPLDAVDAMPLTMRRVVTTFEPPVEEPEPAIPPLVIAPLVTELIEVDAGSGVMPIEIEPLQIEPLRGD